MFKDNKVMPVPFMIAKEYVFALSGIYILPVYPAIFYSCQGRVLVIFKMDGKPV
jgi:hypothetical protein